MTESFVLYGDEFFNERDYRLVRNGILCGEIILPSNYCSVDLSFIEVKMIKNEFLRLGDNFDKIKELYYDFDRLEWI